MLGKVIKYEIKNSYKLMLIMFGAFLLFTVFGCISVAKIANAQADSYIPDAFSIILFILYIMAAGAMYIATIIYQCIRFHKTMYSEQGYLTHTLPTSTMSIFNTKLIASVVWALLAVIVLALSFLGVIYVATICIEDFSLKDLSEIFKEMFDNFWNLGISPKRFITIYAICFLLGIFKLFLWIYTSMAVGQLVSQNRNLTSFAAGIGFYVVNQIFGSFIFNLNNMGKFLKATTPAEYGEIISYLYVSAIAYVIVTNVILYSLSLFINTKKLNLQ